MRPRGIVLEGLTGAGKTCVLRVLRGHPVISGLLKEGKVFDEDATLGGTLVPGDVMDELADSSKSDAFRWRRLDAVLSGIESLRTAGPDSGLFIVERFHLTYFDLVPDRALFASYDSRLKLLNAGIVLLTYPEAEIAPPNALSARPGAYDLGAGYDGRR